LNHQKKRVLLMRLLIVDYDCEQINIMLSWLKARGYDVERASTAEQAQRAWKQQQPDLVIIDPAHQGVDALAMCRQMQQYHDALILVVTAEKDVREEVRCLEAGADDYLRKPFFPKQLLARIRALLRSNRAPTELQSLMPLVVGELTIDPLRYQVHIGGRIFRVTPMESTLLWVLAVNVNHCCSASQLAVQLWANDGIKEAARIKKHIHSLRQKIEPDPSHPCFLLTVPDAGYMLRCHSSERQR
jgi:DNA-binding response OmpR family regulator